MAPELWSCIMETTISQLVEGPSWRTPLGMCYGYVIHQNAMISVLYL